MAQHDEGLIGEGLLGISGRLPSMKEVTMLVRKTCSHCKKAREFMEEICREQPQYREVVVKQIDEIKESAYADEFDYYLVPAYFVGDEKLHEGIPSKEAVEKVYAAALV
jgi:glutaredoxin